MSEYDSIQLDGTWLRPSPFVSTSYEYAKSGDYTIGGVLLVTLSGTLVAKDIDCKDILTQMENIRAYNNDRLACRKLIIGCSGDPTFLEGTGKIRSATATKGDQPCIATYNIVIAIETKANGSDPIIDPDPEFLALYGLTKDQLKGVGKYEETLSLQGEASNLDLVDSELNISKSYVKFNGKISISSLSGGKICGTNTNVLSAFITLIKDRYKKFMTASFDAKNPLYGKLSEYGSWQKWLDTNDIDIDASNGSVTWSFSLIMNNGSCQPMALVDINTTDAMDQKTKKMTRSIQGTINGLSISTDTTFLENGVSKTERVSNAKLVFNSIKDQIVNGVWPQQSPPTLSTPLVTQPSPGNKICGPIVGGLCYQRMSSSNTVSPILGQISFSAEFQDIESTKPIGNNSITYSVDEKLSAWNIVEILIPAEEQSVIQQINTNPHTVIIEVMGQLSGCDNAKITETKCMVDDMFDILAAPYKSWLVIDKSVIQSQRSFRRRKEFLECDNNM